jgi:chromosome segregation ATPase
MAMDWNRDAIDQLDGEWSEDIASLPDYDFAPEEIREIQHKLEDSQAKIDDIRENLNQVDSMIYNLQQEKQEFVDNYEKQEKEQSFSRSR